MIVKQHWKSELVIKYNLYLVVSHSEKEKTIEASIDNNKKEHEIINPTNYKIQNMQANETNKKLKLEEIKLNEFREEKIRIEGIVSTNNETLKQLDRSG